MMTILVIIAFYFLVGFLITFSSFLLFIKMHNDSRYEINYEELTDGIFIIFMILWPLMIFVFVAFLVDYLFHNNNIIKSLLREEQDDKTSTTL